ncbi:MAG: putative toxin-antitoxin system toxin component, PIN family [Nitrososphaerota archaeon]|nr:putative toxin-antitoxin system toxin component, PIN family [Nitrososphaerota archaeon]
MRRAVLDTNVLVSAIISEGKPRELLNRGIRREFTIITSGFILKELATVMRRPRFRTSQGETDRVIAALIQSSEVVEVKSRFTAVKGDPADDMVINTAYDGHADTIVTGDKLFLALGSFRRVRILSVSDALSQS